MFPFRYSSIFRSRWIALFWAAGIVWMAIQFAGGSHDAGNNSDTSSADDARRTAELLNAMGQ